MGNLMKESGVVDRLSNSPVVITILLSQSE
jgi:Na+-transporting methylmalonyl-CoA/oxaloacetate decarboxylase beta subunit